MSHLLLSNSFLGGFFVRMLSGFLPGRGDFPREDILFWLSERVGAEGTALPARREGLLWVWEDGSTLRSFEVTDSPLEISSNTAPMSAGLLVVEAPLGGIGGGGGALSNLGKGGGGGGPPVDDCGVGDLADEGPALTSSVACSGSTPLGFQVRPVI